MAWTRPSTRPWTRRRALAAAGAAAALPLLSACGAAPPGGKTGGGAEGGGDGGGAEADASVALDHARLTASLTAALGDSPWAEQARGFAPALQAALDALRARGMAASADTLATGANQLLAPFADIAAAAVAMGDDPTALRAVQREALQSVLDARDAFVDRLPGLRAELSAQRGDDLLPAVADPAVFAELEALEVEARAAMGAIDGGAGNGPANGVIRAMQEQRASLRADGSLSGLLDRFEGAFTGDRATTALRQLRAVAAGPPPAPPPDAAEELVADVCFALFFVPIGPTGVTDDILLQGVLAMLGIPSTVNPDDACSLATDGMALVLALIDMVLVFVEVAAAFAALAALSAPLLLFMLTFLIAVWMSLKLLCDAITIATVLDQCAG